MQTRENILHPHDKGLISRRQEPKQTIRVQQQAKDSVGVIMGNVSNRLRCLTLDPQPLALFEEVKETLRDGALKEELHPCLRVYCLTPTSCHSSASCVGMKSDQFASWLPS